MAVAKMQKKASGRLMVKWLMKISSPPLKNTLKKAHMTSLSEYTKVPMNTDNTLLS